MRASLPGASITARRDPPHDAAGRLAFVGLLAITFAAATAATAVHARAQAPYLLPLCGGASLAMPVTGPAAISFLTMWTVMMAAMMLPSLAPVLYGYRQAASRAGGWHASLLAMLAGASYFGTWILAGAAAYLFEVARANLLAWQPALAVSAPYATAVVLVVAGAFQCSAWKAGRLARCRRVEPAEQAPCAAAAWRLGGRLGWHCLCSCAGFTAVLLALGSMDPRVMSALAAAITVERLAPWGRRCARATGAALIIAGPAWLMAVAMNA